MEKQVASRRTLARHINAVLKHPDTPVPLYNAMVVVLNDWVEVNWENPAGIERVLETAAKQEKGGA
jgi:hypothetical protein